jgi:hypothetical protein
MSDLISESLNACTVDITGDVYQRFFAADPAAAELMDHSDQYMKGRMLQEVLELMLTDDPANYLAWEVRNHVLSYDVDVAMYASLLDALQAALAAALGERWSASYAQAWEGRTALLLDRIMRLASIEELAK